MTKFEAVCNRGIGAAVVKSANLLNNYLWVGGSIKQNDISAAASASDDRHLIIIVCLLQKCAYTSLYIYFEGLKLLIFLKNTHRGDRRTKKERIICQNRKWVKMKERSSLLFTFEGKKQDTSIYYLDWLFVGIVRHSETILGKL